MTEKYAIKQIRERAEEEAEDAWEKEMVKYYRRAKAHAKKDIEVEMGEWKAVQVYAYERGLYGLWIMRNDRLVSHSIGKYQTEEEIRELLKGYGKTNGGL